MARKVLMMVIDSEASNLHDEEYLMSVISADAIEIDDYVLINMASEHLPITQAEVRKAARMLGIGSKL